MPWARKRREAARISSTVEPFSIASRIFCDPDSAPIHTVRHPARASAATASSSRRSARERHLNGMTPSRATTRSAKSTIQPGFSPKMSSKNATWSGACVRFIHRSSAATRPGLRVAYVGPCTGVAHQLQRYGQPRLVTAFIEK
jgi:hypothetical protein